MQLCGGYFFFYVLTGIAVKYFRNDAAGYPGLGDVQFLAYSTLGGSLVCLVVVFAFGWWRMQSIQRVPFLGFQVPVELAYIVPSGVCTAVVIPATTALYSLPISVMVAMVIMRGSVIVISRSVDAVQIKQGILTKRVYWQEDVAVVFALLAIASVLFWPWIAGAILQLDASERPKFDFIRNPAAVAILLSYITAYSFRIYIMNYFKNTRGRGADGKPVKQDNKGFFALEQIAASVTMLLLVAGLLIASSAGWNPAPIAELRGAIFDAHPSWIPAVVAGGFPYGFVAFFSVFIFMFQGRTATFAGLVNRLTSLIAGTCATLVTWQLFGGRFPRAEHWISLVLILVAVGFLTLAERRRAAERAAAPAAPLEPVPQTAESGSTPAAPAGT